jgi:hypothetical protein
MDSNINNNISNENNYNNNFLEGHIKNQTN